MAARRTQLKGRTNTQSTGGNEVGKATAAILTRKKKMGTPAGHSRTGKCALGRQVSPRPTAKLNVRPVQKMPTKMRKTKAGARTRKKSARKDEYEFNETDVFSAGNSFLSTSFSAGSSKKALKCEVLRNLKASKSDLTNCQKGTIGKQKKVQSQLCGLNGSKEKTSTPLSEVANQVPIRQPGRSRGSCQQYMQITLPKLDFDISVTPILSISANQSLGTRMSPRQKARKHSVAKSVSFQDDLKEPLSAQTPAGKRNKKTQRQLAVANNLANISASGSFKEPAPVLVSAPATASSAQQRRTVRKRKTSETTSSVQSGEASTPEKRNKSEERKQPVVNSNGNEQSCKVHPSPLRIRRMQSVVTSEERGQSHKVSKPTKKTTSSSVRDGGSGSSSKQLKKHGKPVPSTLKVFSGEQLQDEQAGQFTPVYDSGISMGEDLNMSEDRYSEQTLSLPGFMEDEPMPDSLEYLENSPLSIPTGIPSLTEVSVYKNAVKEYKMKSTKREKGRYSTSKVDAWASAMNQSLQDVESFELVVE